jgi:hypothetical protein
VPALKPNLIARIGVKIAVYTDSWVVDADNYLKFYMDALSPTRGKGKIPKKVRQQLIATAFAAWGNDNQIDHVEVDVYRGAEDLCTHIFAYDNPHGGRMETKRPIVGQIVHLVASDRVTTHADGSTSPDIRALLITAVGEYGNTDQLFVNGIIFRSDQHDPIFQQLMHEVTQIPQDDNGKVGTWHWPPAA